ncbi:hypothetical protein [Actinoplanes xinjiangensis]|uniref:Protein kinase domain-containing protein n=1 Tax=Actinoplanes xinjiangensis TaxID=512350 RepID=A0A316FVT0_9ACTN|nr:hypothetical protein [Actinoplanes xinjiangensis]PWK52698.1 hypothetical protein BC793_101707 [Actinoplanes xinjiangensis]GIF36609.1 hypothetical protein Axi01nite_09200 [Actinoplanes xinjiangensis]
MYPARGEVRAGTEIFHLRSREECVAADGGCRVLRGDARQGSTPGREVRLVRLDVVRGGAGAERRRAELKAEARLHDAVPGLPRVVFRCEEPLSFTFATRMPPGVMLTELYGRPPWAGAVLRDVLRGIALVGRTLQSLHEWGRAHRALRPEVLFASRDRMWLRDAGLAATPPEAGEGAGAYRAPEQRRATGGPATDVYRLAAVVYHLVTGEAPGVDPLPVSRLRPEWAGLDEPLAAALDPEPQRRPALADLISDLTHTAQR